MTRLFRWFPLVSCLIGWNIPAATELPRPITQVIVKVELERLMNLNGFEVRGIERTADVRGHVEGTELLDRLHSLLENFDHVIVQNGHGGVDRVLILGEKSAYTPPAASGAGKEGANADDSQDQGEIVVTTQRKGSSHSVTVDLEGVNQQRVSQEMLIDTGAEQVVLPASLIQPLGLAPDGLRSQQVQTANGPVDARIGRLPAIWFGDKRVRGVDAAFIEDQRLGGNALLGMNVLGRFRMTIDDAENRLTLGGK